MSNRGRPPSPGLLTPRERDVARLVGQRLSNREIAGLLEISEPAVRYHLNQIYAKTGLTRREDLSEWAARRSWAPSLAMLKVAISGLAAVAVLGIAATALVVALRANTPDAEANPLTAPTIADAALPGGAPCRIDSRLLVEAADARCYETIDELRTVVAFDFPAPGSIPPSMVAAVEREGRLDAFLRYDADGGELDYLAGFLDISLDLEGAPLAISARSTPHIMGFFDRSSSWPQLTWCPYYDGLGGTVERRCPGELAVVMSGSTEFDLAMAVLDALDGPSATDAVAATTPVPYPTPAGERVSPLVADLPTYPGATEVDGFRRGDEVVQVFEVGAQPRDIAMFYRDYLTSAGWILYQGSGGVAGESQGYQSPDGAWVTFSTVYQPRPQEDVPEPPPGYRGKGVPFENAVDGNLRFWLITRAPG